MPQQVLVVDRLFVRDALYMGGQEIKGLQAGDHASEAVNKAQLDAISSTDELVAVTGADTTPGYLGAKLVAGTGVTLNTLNPGANEQVEIVTAGSPPAGANTQIQFNNAGAFGASADLVFDGTNLGVGTSAPAAVLDVAVATVSASASTYASTAAFQSDTPGSKAMVGFFGADGTIGGPQFNGFKARGTNAAPATANADDILFGLSGYAYETSTYKSGAAITIKKGSGTASTFRTPSYIAFNTTPANGSEDILERMRIVQDGEVGIGRTPAAGYTLDVSGPAGTIRTTGTTNTLSGDIVAENDSAEYVVMKQWGTAAAGTRFGVARSDSASVFTSATHLSVGTVAAGADLVLGSNDVAAMTIDGTTQNITIINELNMATVTKGITFGDGDTSIRETFDDVLMCRVAGVDAWTWGQSAGTNYLTGKAGVTSIFGGDGNTDVIRMQPYGQAAITTGGSVSAYGQSYGLDTTKRGAVEILGSDLILDTPAGPMKLVGVNTWASTVTNLQAGNVEVTGGASAIAGGIGGDVLLTSGVGTGADGDLIFKTGATSAITIDGVYTDVTVHTGLAIKDGTLDTTRHLDVGSTDLHTVSFWTTRADGYVTQTLASATGTGRLFQYGTSIGGTLFGQSRNDLFAIYGDQHTTIGTGAGDLTFGTSDTLAMTIDGSSQDVGIGTTPVTGSQLCLPSENDAVTPTLSFGDGDSGFYEQADDVVGCTIAGNAKYYWNTNGFGIGIIPGSGEVFTAYSTLGATARFTSGASTSWAQFITQNNNNENLRFRMYGSAVGGGTTVMGNAAASMASIDANTGELSLSTAAASNMYIGTNDTLAITIDGTNQDVLLNQGVLALAETTAPTPVAGEARIWTDSNNDLWMHAGDGTITLLNALQDKSEAMTTQGLGSGTFYIFGDYDASATDSNLTQASATQTFGTANGTYASHAFVVAAAAGTASGGAGLVEIEVSGTSIDDLGNRTTSDTEVIVADITAMATDQYFETTKKWLGQITYTLQVAGAGTHTTFAADFNFGFCKYEDFGNRDFDIHQVEVTGLAGANDSSFDVELLHHTGTGWTYAATGFVPGNGAIAQLTTDHGTESELINTKPFAWKRTNLNEEITGSGIEGIIARITTGANNAIEILNCHLSSHIIA